MVTMNQRVFVTNTEPIFESTLSTPLAQTVRILFAPGWLLERGTECRIFVKATRAS